MGTTASRRWATDATLAAVVIGLELGVSLGAAGWHGRAESQPGPFGIVVLVLGGVALVSRRAYPVAVLAIVLAATLGASALGVAFVWPALIVAFFTAVLCGRRLAAIASLVVGYGFSVRNASAEFALLLAAGLVTLLSVAEASRAWRDWAAADRRRRDEAAGRRASEQRLAIARDLHDVVAHSISVINVQANVALHLMDRQPERARDALTAIREVSGQALAELGPVLGALRDGGAPLAPVPGVARLGELAERARAAGFDVSVTAQGAARDLPTGVDAAAYRIVQEALTNTVRHSGGRSAKVLLRYGDDDLVIEVDDDGNGGPGGESPGASRVGGAVLADGARADGARADGALADGALAGGAPTSGSGNGLAGMAERARALGGTLEAGPGPDGGFRVLARLPA